MKRTLHILMIMAGIGGMTVQVKAAAGVLSDTVTSALHVGEGVAAREIPDLVTKFIKEMDQAALKKLGGNAADLEAAFLKKITPKGEGVAARESAETIQKEMTELVTKMTEASDSLALMGIKSSSIGAENLMKIDSKALSEIQSKIQTQGVKFADIAQGFQNLGIDAPEASILAHHAMDSQEVLAGTFLNSTKASKHLQKIMGEAENLDRYTLSELTTLKQLKSQLETATTLEQRAAITHQIAGMEYKASTTTGKVLRRLRSVAGASSPYLIGSLSTIGVSVLFMIPSLFQSAFLAQQAQNALLETYLPPVSFGGLVLQMPDSAINLTNPAQSQFIYYAIPVTAPGASLSPAAKAAFPGVSGPTDKNKVSKEINNDYAKAFSLGGAKSIHVLRYNLDASALSSLPIYVPYSSQSWNTWGSCGIPDAAFSQMMICLNTGEIFYADGTPQGTAPAPLVTLPGASGATTVQSFLATKYGQLKSAGDQATYTQFIDSYATAKGGKIDKSISDLFNCSCLEHNHGILSADTVQSCSGSKSSTCLLSKALQQIGAGIVLNAQGTELAPNQDLATEIANGALGQVVPIQGLGQNFDAILQMFPGAQQQALANSGALTISLGFNPSQASSQVIGADPDNYAAKGVYVYQCQNTPLAKVLKNQAGGTSASNAITDYIVFLDENLNQVPLMVPMHDPNNYNFSKMGLNPSIQYFSTLIGNVDSSGNFSFVPQLNIQSPAALVAKGLPANFAPLYGIQATNGSLAVNYNQNLPAIIGTIVQSLSNNQKLGQQFKTMQTAMLSLLSSGPFGKYQLMPVAATMQPSIGGISLVSYTGFNGYPVSQDTANSACTDLLIPVSAAGKTVNLPSNTIAQYYGLVTDLTYTVRADGTIAVDPAGFANSPLSASLTINQKLVSQFYWMNKLTAMGKAANPGFTMPAQLVSFVSQARTAWLNWIAAQAGNVTTMQEYAGVKVPGTSMVLTIASSQALQNGLYIYTASPSPSALATQDYFILSTNGTPQASDGTLGSMSATKATATTNLISLVSGAVYTMAGKQVTNSVGAPYSIAVASLLKTLEAKNSQAFSNDLRAKLNIAGGLAVTASQSLLYPFPFGGLQLGIYQADLQSGVYLYIDAAGAGSSQNFVAEDYFVTVDSYTKPQKFGTKLTAQTNYIVSLVSGNVYNASGVIAVCDQTVLQSILGSMSPTFRSGIAQQISVASAAFTSMMQQQQQQTAAINNAQVGNVGQVTLTQSAVATILDNLDKQDYLQDPYGMLKKDPVSGMYALITPASADGATFIYTFFDVPNSFTDASGHLMHVGATYDGQGNLLRVITGAELSSMLYQYGVAVDSTGRQYLGAQGQLPAMPLADADKNLQPGVSGKSMVYSNNKSFPSVGIVSPITYQNNKLYIYFNTINGGYYAMQVGASDSYYIDMAGGNIYNLDGTPRMQLNPVAINQNGDVTDMLLPYLNPENFLRCVVQNSANHNSYSDFINIVSDFQISHDIATGDSCGLNSLISLDSSATTVNLAQMPFNENSSVMPSLASNKIFNLYVEQSQAPVSYVVNGSYQWQNLQLLPIDLGSRALLQPTPSSLYMNARLIFKNKVPFACIFAGQLYGNMQKNGTTSYTMSNGTQTITCSQKVDPKTQVMYLAISAAGQNYAYQYTMMTLTEAQLQQYRQSGWDGDIVADVSGKVILEKYLSTDSSGSLQLVPVSMASVINPPSNQSDLAVLQNGLSSLLKDPVNGRFVAPIAAGQYSYSPQAGYVDIQNGVIFDQQGITVGYTLAIADLMNLVQSLSITVAPDGNNQLALRYRVSAFAKPVSVAAPSYQPVAQMKTTSSSGPVASSYSSAPVQSSVASQSSYQPAVNYQATAQQTMQQSAPVSYQQPAAFDQVQQPVASSSIQEVAQQSTSSQPLVAPVVSSQLNQSGNLQATSVANPAIVALQKQNASLQNDISQRQTLIAHLKSMGTSQPLAAGQITSNQHAVIADQQQIALNNQQISSLQAANSGRSTILGRFGNKKALKKSDKRA